MALNNNVRQSAIKRHALGGGVTLPSVRPHARRRVPRGGQPPGM